ncbi:MAG: LacI family transcriptional regulator [Phycisphaerae bacterium]|nr:LacI family transcriptional regulator [Phycisphaerae bacterium]
MMKKKKATLSEVAKLAKVSVSTASYAINGYHRISDATKKRVQEAAGTLNYIPNAAARNLKRKKTKTIGIFLHDVIGPFYSTLIGGILEIVNQNNYDLVICISTRENDTAHRFIEERSLDAGIILDLMISDDLLLRVADEHFPIVVLDRILKKKYMRSVLIDNYNGAYDACKHIISQGYKNLAILTGPLEVSETSCDIYQRINGYQNAAKDHNLTIKIPKGFSGDFTEEGGYSATKILFSGKSHPDAILSANDQMAVGAMQAIKECGLRIPEDVGIIGFDNIQLSEYQTPPLSTVEHPVRKRGIIAAQLIFNMLNHSSDDDEFEPIILPTNSVIRKSSVKNN